MKEFFLEILAAITGAFLSVIAAVFVVVIGGLMVGYGIYKEWEWLTNGGIFVAVLGCLFVTRFWFGDD